MSRALSLVVSAVILLAGVRAAEAMCAGRDATMDVWPAARLAPTGFIHIAVEGNLGREAFARAEVALRLGELELRAADGPERVPLQRVWHGDTRTGVTQALLRPVWSLQVGTSYHLRLGDQLLAWQIEEPPGLAAPGWAGEAAVIEQKYFGGCPSGGHMLMTVPVLDGRGELHMLVRATSVATGRWTELVVPVVDHAIEVRFGGCGGGFDLEPMEEYRFELAVLDEAGHLVPMPGALIARTPGRDAPAPEAVPPVVVAAPRWMTAGWAYGLGLIGLAFALGATFLSVRFIVRSDR